MKEFNTWKTKKGNKLITTKIKDMSTLHICKALTMEINNFDYLNKQHEYYKNKLAILDSQIEETALTGANMQEELNNRNITFKFNKTNISEETKAFFFDNYEENKEKPKISDNFTKPILEK